MNNLIAEIIEQNRMALEYLTQDQGVFTPEEVAGVLKVDKSTVYRMVKEGSIDSVKVRGSVRIKNLRNFIDEGGSKDILSPAP